MKVIWIFWLAMTILTVVLSVIMLVDASLACNLSTIEVNTVEQLEKEWNQQPFVSINVRE